MAIQSLAKSLMLEFQFSDLRLVSWKAARGFAAEIPIGGIKQREPGRRIP